MRFLLWGIKEYMRDVVRKLARQSKTAIIIYKLIDNRRLRKRVASGDIETTHGSTLLKQNLQESLAYIEKQFTDYLKYAGLSAESLKGKRILELGPGDNLGVALRFLSAGAESVVYLDRFYSKRDPAHERNVYMCLQRDSTC